MMSKNNLIRVAEAQQFIDMEFKLNKDISALVELAAEICETPVAWVTVLDEQKQHIKFSLGTDVKQTEREYSFCQYTIETPDPMQVEDALNDPRFMNSPLVFGDPHIRFYAGAPLITDSGQSIGSLCVIDNKPSKLNSKQLEMLSILSRQVILLMQLERSDTLLKGQLAQLEEQSRQIRNADLRLRAFFESTTTYHLLLDKDMLVLDYNKVARDYIKKLHRKDVVVGRPITDFLSEKGKIELHDNFKRSLAGHITSIRRFENYNKLGDIWWGIIYEPIRDSELQIIGVAINATNISAEVEKENKISTQKELLKNIAFMQSHEFRRPVASIKGLFNLINEAGVDPDHEWLQYMESAVNELDEKIHYVVNYCSEPEDMQQN